MYVLDTNILVAALWSRTGASFRVVEYALSGQLPFAISVAMALEYEAVLKRAAIREASWRTGAEPGNLLDALLLGSMRVGPIRKRLRPALSDPADDMVLECAVQVGAEAIVTMNVRDFRSARGLYRVDAIMPGALLARLRKGEA